MRRRRRSPADAGGLPALAEVDDLPGDLAELVVGLGEGPKPKPRAESIPERDDRGVGEERRAAEADVAAGRTLQQPVSDDDIGPRQLVVARRCGGEPRSRGGRRTSGPGHRPGCRRRRCSWCCRAGFGFADGKPHRFPPAHRAARTPRTSASGPAKKAASPSSLASFDNRLVGRRRRLPAGQRRSPGRARSRSTRDTACSRRCRPGPGSRVVARAMVRPDLPSTRRLEAGRARPARVCRTSPPANGSMRRRNPAEADRARTHDAAAARRHRDSRSKVPVQSIGPVTVRAENPRPGMTSVTSSSNSPSSVWYR